MLDTKKKIEEIKTKEGQEFPADRLKLINLGKIMEDEKPLKDYNLKEGSFIVCMV